MDQTYPQMLQFAGKTILVTATAAFEVIAAPEVLVAVGTGEASYAALEALGSIKAVSREEATILGAEERARFGGSVAAMRASGHLESPFQNPAYVNSLPTQAQIMAIAPHPVPMNAPSITHAPTSPTDHIATYPGYTAPIDQIHLPGGPGVHGHVGPLTTPNTGPAGILELDKDKYPSTPTTAEGAAIVASIQNCKLPNGVQEFALRNTFGALKNAMDSYPAGWEPHHIVEQNQTSRFGSQAIQNTANIVALPDSVHDRITDIYRRAPENEQLAERWPTLRKYAQTLTYQGQRELGMSILKEALGRTPESELSNADRARIQAEINKIDRTDICPVVPKPELPDLPDLNSVNDAVQGHNQQSNARLPDARSVAKWDGTTRSGTFLELGNGLVAQHQGQGAYAVADVQRDLNGQQPPIGQYATLQQNGQVQVPQQTLGRGLGMG